jgi:hypothetical protein
VQGQEPSSLLPSCIVSTTGDVNAFFTFEGDGGAYVLSIKSDFEATLSVYEGSCSDLLCVDALGPYYGYSGYGYYFGPLNELIISTVPGASYYLVVSSLQGDTGKFKLAVEVS